VIEVTYHRKYHGLTVTGHAKCGEKGHDLVCASVSALVLTLAANISGLAARDVLRDYNIRTGDGEAEVSCVPVRRMSDVVSLIYDTVCNGMELLGSLYPENISYQVLG
jgi:uncharacterized protein YsxB (DUF464 family)